MSEKLLRHVVLIQFTDEATEEQVSEVRQAFLAMPAQIAEIHQLEWGNAINKTINGDFHQLKRVFVNLNEGTSYSHCLFVTFRSEADLKVYEEHPAHKAVPEQFGPLFAGFTVVYYWI